MRRRLAMWTASHLMRPLPSPGEVHVWCLFPEDITGEDTALWKTYKELLSAREKTDIAQCSSNPKLQTEKLLARTLMQVGLWLLHLSGLQKMSLANQTLSGL